MLKELLYPYDIDSLDNRDPSVVDRLCRLIGEPLFRYFRAEVRGLDHVPAGATLIVGNHNGGSVNPEAYLLGTALCRRFGPEAVPHGLGHEWVINLPGINRFIIPLGAVRASHENAQALLARGRKVMVYPGSDFDSLRPFRERDRIVFGGRTGYMRLALSAGVPILPVVAAGAHSVFVVLNRGRRTARLLGIDRSLRIKVWPWVLSVPWGLTFGPPLLYFPLPSRVLLEALPPIRFDRDGPEAARDAAYVRTCADVVEAAMQAKLHELAAELNENRA